MVHNIYERHAVRPGFSIVADQERKYYDLYKVQPSVVAAARSLSKIPHWVNAVKTHGFKQGEVDGNVFMVPALFLVDAPSRKIIKAEYSSNFYDHLTFTGIYEALTFKTG